MYFFTFFDNYCQKLEINQNKSLSIKEEKTNINLLIPIEIKNNTSISYVISIEPEQNSATEKVDFDLTTTILTLNSSNKFKDQINLNILADHYKENLEEVSLNIEFKDDAGTIKSEIFKFLIEDLLESDSEGIEFTPEELKKVKHASLDIFTGGNFDFFNALKIKNVGGEFVVNVNNIIGKENRFGGFLGISNFQNFSIDSSNSNIRKQYIRIDSGPYISGTTKYIQNQFIDRRILNSSQWSYYINPTYRLNKEGALINIFLSLRLEALRKTTVTQFKSDTISINDTTNVALINPVFQSGKGFLLQNLNDVVTNGFMSIGIPIFINAKDKFKLYIDSNIGLGSFTKYYLLPGISYGTINKEIKNILKPFYLFRLRVSEQFSGLNITLGGEIRAYVPSYSPTINAYLGIRANLFKWFSKEG